MMKVSMRAVEKDLDKYLDLAHAGTEIVITKNRVPWAMFKPSLPEKRIKKSRKSN